VAANNYNDFSILSINPNNINDWQAVYTSNLFYGTSAAIVTDGTYVYGVSYTTPAKFFKIRISDWTLVSSQVWDNGHSGHGASLIQYPDKSLGSRTDKGWVGVKTRYATDHDIIKIIKKYF
jgi:hypothetical protein